MTNSSPFAQKALSGSVPSSAEWEEHLKSCHQEFPSQTPACFASHRAENGLNSYEYLASAVAPSGAETLVVDLACGDGYLLHSLLKIEGIRVTGVDMSEAELAQARQIFQLHSNVHFLTARAQELPLESGSASAVLCHMAFMLMNPIEPVVKEIARVLKSGGIFAAVVDRKIKDGRYGEVGQILRGFFAEQFPNLPGAMPTNDPRVASLEGLKELFCPAKGFQAQVEIEDFSLSMSLSRAEFWDLYKYSYFVEMVPAAGLEQLRMRLDAYFSAHAIDGKITLGFPMRRIIARTL